MTGLFKLAPTDWSALRRLLHEALALEARHREAWLDRMAAIQAQQVPRHRALLSHAAPAEPAAFTTLPKIETASLSVLLPPQHALPEGGRLVGPYRLLQLLGEGGMASVWLAERQDLMQRRRFALKLPRACWRQAAWAERLAREREILSALEHPHIARLYDAGVDTEGQPYLALQYVEGEHIDVHCRRLGLGVRERLGLFLQVARAVAHAHARLVVHRDLKPSNILVDAGGRAHLLDFGIAKLLDEGVAAETQLTVDTGRALTLRYASPEQVLGEPVGTATDVYSLGVLLHELLSGQGPYAWRHGSRAALEQAVLEAEPSAPSEVVSDPRLRRRLRGDIDTIVLKALKKAPGERYATVDAMAGDVERLLSHRPVLARPDGPWYRAARFAVRHRLVVSAAAAVLVAMMAGTGVAAWQALVARAEQEKAQEVKEFIASILRDADPWSAGESPGSIAELLKQAKHQVDASFADRPELQVELLNIVGMSLLHRQDPAAAEAALSQSLGVARAKLAPAHPQAARARIYMAEVHLERGRVAQARAELEQALSMLGRVRSAEAGDLVTAWWNLSSAEIDEGKYAQAMQSAQRARDLAVARLGPEARLTAGATVNLALAQLYAGRAEAALPTIEQGYRLMLQAYGQERHPQVVEALDIHGRILAASGRVAHGVAMLERALSLAKEVAGRDSLAVGTISWKLASLQIEARQVDQALAHSEAAVRIIPNRYAEDSIHHGRALRVRGRALLAARRADEAAPVLQRAHRIFVTSMGTAHPETQALEAEYRQAAKARIPAVRTSSG